MGRSKPPAHSSAPPRVEITEHFTENSSPLTNTFTKNARRDKTDAAKMSAMQMDPPGGRRRMGRAAKVQTPESESSLSPVEVDSSNDGGNVGSGSSAANMPGSECRRSSRKKTIKFDVRDLLNKNRNKNHKIQIEARIDSNAPKSGAGPASKEELDNKQKTFIEKSAIFRRYSFSENKQPPRPPPPPVALIKSIQQCVGELDQLPLDRDMNLAAISPIARRLSRTQEILTASMMKPKQVNSLIVTKLENATTSSPAATRKGARQKQSAAESPPTQIKRRGRPKKGKAGSDSMTESSNDSTDASESATVTSPTAIPEGVAKSDENSASANRETSLSPTSSTKAIDLMEKTDASAVTLSPSELMEPNMFVGAEEEVFTQGLSSDESTVFLRGSPKEKSNDEISLFGRSDSTETNSSDDSERRRKKIRVSVKRVTLPSALREHVDVMVINSTSTPDAIEILSSNDDESLNSSKEANRRDETSLNLRPDESSQDSSKPARTRWSSKRQTEQNVDQLEVVVDGDSSSMAVGSIVEISSDSTATPVDELLTKKKSVSPQKRITPPRRMRSCRRQGNEDVLEVQTVQPVENTECTEQKELQEPISNEPDEGTLVEKFADITQAKVSPKQTKKSVQKQQQEVPSLKIQEEKPYDTESVGAEAKLEEKSVPTKSVVCSLAPRTRSQRDVQTENVGNENNQSDSSRKTPATRSSSLRKLRDVVEQKENDSVSPTNQTIAEEQMSSNNKEPKGPISGVTVTENLDLKTQEAPDIHSQPDGNKLKEEDIRISPTIATATSPVAQKPVDKVQNTDRCFTRVSLGRAQLLKAIKDSVSSSDVETESGKLTESEASPKKLRESSRKVPPTSPKQEQSEEMPTKESSPVTRKTSKTSKHIARVVSTDQSSSSSERSESPKGHTKKKSPESKEQDTSSICSESSSVESSSSSSFSSTTASSNSSSTSSTSTSSKSSTTSTSSTSSSSGSDVHSRTTRSRRSQQLVLESAESNARSAVIRNEEQSLTGPESENSEQSLRRGKVKAAPEISPKERAKLVQRRRSMRANRFQLDEESNETSSESSETSSTRITRTSRSKARSDIPPTLKKTSRSVESMRSPKATIESKNKDNTESLEKQKATENSSKSSDSSSGDQLRLEMRPKKKTGRFAPLKGMSPDRAAYDDTSVSHSTMRETRARRKTISSASELEELQDHRIGKYCERKTKAKPPVVEETKEKLEDKKADRQEQQNAEVADEMKQSTETKELHVQELQVGGPGEIKRNGEDEKADRQNQQETEVSSEKVPIGANNEDEANSAMSEKPDEVDKVEGCRSSESQSLGGQKEVGLEANGGETKVSQNKMQQLEDENIAPMLDNEVQDTDVIPNFDAGNKPSDIAVEDQEYSTSNLIPSVTEASTSEVNNGQPAEDSTPCSQEATTTTETTSNSVSESVEVSHMADAVQIANNKIRSDEKSQGEEQNLLPIPTHHQSVSENAESALLPKEAKKPETITDFLKQSLLPAPTGSTQVVEQKEQLVSDSIHSLAATSAASSVLPILQADQSLGIATGVQDSTEESTNSADSRPAGDSFSEGKSKKENSNEIQAPQTVKKQVTPRKKKKADQQESLKPKNEKDPVEGNVELGTTESSNSEDSHKSDVGKTDSVSTPSRQLDSSFIDSLEKSLVKSPALGKKLQKKKEKPQPAPVAAPKEKEDPQKKSKKNQEKVDAVAASPKSKKKLKDTMKGDKKPETESLSKRKATGKNKNVDDCKPIEAGETNTVVLEVLPEVPQPTVTEDTISQVVADVAVHQLNEAPANPPKPMKSKGETKFYPDEHVIEEKMDGATEDCSPNDVQKENSPDPVPDPLKDIEKFIEDGVNLLKRGYKLEESEESSGNTELIKSDETTTPKKCKLDENSDEKKQTHLEDDNSNSNSEHSLLTSTPNSDVDAPNGIRRSHRIKNNSKSAKCLVGRGLVRDRERFSMKDDEKTVYSIDDQKLDLAEVEAKNSKFLKDMEERLSNFRVIRENEYKCERVISKEAKRMLCDCFLTAEEEERGELGCGEDCLNRLLMIECGSDCTVKERCTNRRFTKFLYSPCRVFRTEKKGFGIMADIEILPGEFIMEYVGEVIDGDEFERRRNVYSQDKNKHYYFMALRSDAIIDATAKGNVSRFINHSCDPNAETQKWTVNGELRIGFFSRKSIMRGEEITFDYQYQRYGKEAQKCYCESSNCRGWIGEEPSSEEEEEEEDVDEEGETESEEEEVPEAVPSPAIPLIVPAVATEGGQLVPETPVVGKDLETSELLPVFTQVSVEPAKPPAEVPIKKKKEKRRQLERKEEKIKRRETKQYLEDPDIEDEVRFLVKCGLRNQADTLRLSRLIVRAKLLGTRLKLLQILRAGELPCRRLFLDYHGLRLLHGWMSEVIDTRDCEKSMEIRMALLSVLECLPIPNKTMLTDSKVYQTVRDWSNNKESHSPNDESPKETPPAAVPSSSPARSDDPSTELQKLAAKLVNTWDNLPEVFRIPKRERIEQMKEHEREADRQYKGLGEDASGSEERRNRDRFIRIGPNSSRFKWSRSEKDKERERDRRRYLANGGSGKDGLDKTQSTNDSHMSKEQRRELFAAKVARDEAEKRLAEERREFDIKCRFFGLDPKRLRPENMPFCVNPSTGQWYSTDKKPISTPPSYAHVQVPVKPKSTNPADYQLPIMDLPPLWKYAISPKGKIYYYHVKIRIPQWEPPIKILPLAGQKNTHARASESDSSNADCVDSSDDDMDIIKGLDAAKLQTYIEKKIEDRRLQRYNRLVEEKPISPRKEEDRIYNQIEVRKYKENKEKIRKRKEEIRRRRDTLGKVATTSIEPNQAEATTAENDDVAADAIPIQDYLLSSDEEDKIKEECNNSPLIDKIVQGDKIVDELDALQCKRPLKRALSIREKYEHKKRKVDKNKESTKSTKRSKEGEGSSSSSSGKYRKIREKFRCEIAGIIVHHLRPYRKETCFSGRILTDDDFNHLARKLTHFVMVKELKYCESIGQTLVVTESVKNKSREFIKKYMAKYGEVYVRPQNDPEFKEIPFL